MCQTPQPEELEREKYEGEVAAIVWHEKFYTASFGRTITAITLHGRWPDTKLLVTSDFAGELRSTEFDLYYTDPWRKGRPLPSATECATGILEAVAES